MVSSAIPVILTIAGFDPSSGAGITADLKTIAAHDCYGVAAITALTVQSTQGVEKVEAVHPNLLRETLAALAADITFAAIKIGMLGTGAVGEVVADFLAEQVGRPIVLDPILRASSGKQLQDDSGMNILRARLLKLATVITPNVEEAGILTASPARSLEQMKAAAKELQRAGARNVVITGGHTAVNIDLLCLETGEEIEITGEKIKSTATHGTGCAFSTALACQLAAGADLPQAVKGAKDYVRRAIEAAYAIGKGTGPMNHLFRLK